MKKLILVAVLLTRAIWPQSAVFPGAAAGDSQLGVAADNVSTTLAAPVSNVDTTIQLVNGARIPVNGILNIGGAGGEMVQVCARSGNTITVGHSACPNVDGRGFGGSTAVSHTTGSVAGMYVNAYYQNALRVEVEALEANRTTGNAGGDLCATFPNPTVCGIDGHSILGITGVLKLTAGVPAAAASNTDYVGTLPSGLVKGNGTATGSTAAAGTDYVATLPSGLVKGNGTATGLSATAGTDYVATLPSGVVIGQGTATALPGVASTGPSQIFRRNAADTAYEFADAPYVTATGGDPLSYLRENSTGSSTEFATLFAAKTTDYIFAAQSPGGSLTGGGAANSITLTPCPLGVNGADVAHQLYISGGTGTAEAVTITGGSCTAGAPSGTIVVNAANAHSGAWTIQSNSAGIQEAINTFPSVVIPPGVHQLYGTITPPRGATIIGSGGALSTDSPASTKLIQNVDTVTTFNVVNDHVTLEKFQLQYNTGSPGCSTTGALATTGSIGIYTKFQGGGHAEGFYFEDLDVYCFWRNFDIHGGFQTYMNNISSVGSQDTTTDGGSMVFNGGQGFATNLTLSYSRGNGIRIKADEGAQPFISGVDEFNAGGWGVYCDANSLCQLSNIITNADALGGFYFANGGGGVQITNFQSSFEGASTWDTNDPQAVCVKVASNVSEGVFTSGILYACPGNAMEIGGDNIMISNVHSNALGNKSADINPQPYNLHLASTSQNATVTGNIWDKGDNLIEGPGHVIVGNVFQGQQVAVTHQLPVIEFGADATLTTFCGNYLFQNGAHDSGGLVIDAGASAGQCNNSINGSVSGAWDWNTHDLKNIPINPMTQGSALTITSNTVAPTSQLHLIGAGTVNTITVPFSLAAHCVQLATTAATVFGTSGNIATGFTASFPNLYTACYSASNGKYYISDSNGSSGAGTCSTLGGDLSGTCTSGSVVKLQNRALAATAPTDQQAILWSAGGSTWAPGTVVTPVQTGAVAPLLQGKLFSVSPVNVPAGTVYQEVCGSGATCLHDQFSWGGVPEYLVRRSNGAFGAPTTILNGDFLGGLGVRGYDGTSMTTDTVNMAAQACANWTSTNHCAVGFASAAGTTTSGQVFKWLYSGTTPEIAPYTDKTLLGESTLRFNAALGDTTIGGAFNYIATEGGANNAIAGTLAGVDLAAGSCVYVKLAHTLQAGADTFNLNSGGAVNIKSHYNTANNIGTAYASTGTVNLCYSGSVWMDMSQ